MPPQHVMFRFYFSLNFLSLCLFLKKLILALVILTLKWFEISIFQAMYEMNFLYDMNLWSSRRFTYLITPSQLYSTNAFPWSRLRCLRGTSRSPPPRNAADLQARLNELIRNNQVDAVRNGNRKHETGIKGWWHGIQCKQNHWQRV